MTSTTHKTATILTLSGILPFLGLSVAVALKREGYDFSFDLIAYGAVIVSFLCGIHWAAYLFFSDRCGRNLLIHSNGVTLIAWASLIVSPHAFGMILQALCLVYLLGLDYELRNQQIIPPWFFSLRRKATIAVVLLLIGAAWLS